MTKQHAMRVQRAFRIYPVVPERVKIDWRDRRPEVSIGMAKFSADRRFRSTTRTI